jgi:proteasome lid subunit RPN8/RPN11
MKLLISRPNLKKVEADARARAPVEACGILVGRQKEGDFEVVDVIKTSNVMESPTRFEIDPEELYRVMKGAEAEGLEIVGFYHSHLGYGAGPSIVDLDRMKFLPNLVWLICDISAEGANFGAFSMRGDKLAELELAVA